MFNFVQSLNLNNFDPFLNRLKISFIETSASKSIGLLFVELCYLNNNYLVYNFIYDLSIFYRCLLLFSILTINILINNFYNNYDIFDTIYYNFLNDFNYDYIFFVINIVFFKFLYF